MGCRTQKFHSPLSDFPLELRNFKIFCGASWVFWGRILSYWKILICQHWNIQCVCVTVSKCLIETGKRGWAACMVSCQPAPRWLPGRAFLPKQSDNPLLRYSLPWPAPSVPDCPSKHGAEESVLWEGTRRVWLVQPNKYKAGGDLFCHSQKSQEGKCCSWRAVLGVGTGTKSFMYI